MENSDFNDDEYQQAYAPSTGFAAPPVATAPAPSAPQQYRTPEGVLLNGTPPPAPPDLERSAALAELIRRVPLDQATKAIEAATRLEGMLGFDADRKAGIPVMEALQKWSPKMYFNHPAAVASLQKVAALKPAVPFVPTSTTIEGQKMFQMSPNRFAFPPGGDAFTPKEVEVGGSKLLQVSPKTYVRVPAAGGADLKVKEGLRDINREIALIDKQIGNTLLPSDVPPLQAKKEALKAQKQTLMQSVGTKSAQTPSVKRLVWKDGQLVPKE